MSETDRTERTPPVDIRRLSLTDFRNYAALSLDLAPCAVVLTGENGAGKTNLLEAVSLFSPGRGLRRAPYADMAREGAPGSGFAIHARLEGPFGECEIGTGTLAFGQEEADARVGRISYNSPLGRALIGRQKGEDVEVTTPSGDKYYLVSKIEFI